MAKVYEFLADGFEEVEGLTPVDVLRRGGVDVTTVSINGTEWVEGAHGVVVKADILIEEADFSDADMLLLPGGMPGSINLDMHEGVRSALKTQAAAGRGIGAICAAPMVLGRLGLLQGCKATCYPGFEKHLAGADYTADMVTVDGNIVTGKGPAASLPYSYTILSLLTDKQNAADTAAGMMWPADE